MKKTHFTNSIDYNNYRDSYYKKYKYLIYTFSVFIYLLELVICIELNGDAWIAMISSVIYWSFVATFTENNAKKHSSIMYRTIWYPFCIFLIIITIPSFLFYIGAFSRYYALGIFDNINNIYIFLTILPSIIDFIGKCFVLRYCTKWITILRWEYDELNLTHSEKRNIQKEERTAYSQGKRQERQKRKEKQKVNIANHKKKNKQIISIIKNNIRTKFASFKTPVNNQAIKNTSVSKLDKLNELKELFNNGIITQKEYDKARADILGK